MKPYHLGYFFVSIFIATTSAVALDANQIVEKANQASYYGGEDGRSQVHMTIQSSDGSVRERQFTILRKNLSNGDQKFYVYFTEPADVRRMTYLVWKHIDQAREDDRWLFLPALNLVKRIAPGDKRTSFVGSDFVYEDVSGRSLQADTHELIEETTAQYKIKNTPKDSNTVEFSYYYVWIDKDTYLPRKAEYYDHNDKVYRRVTADEVQVIDNISTVTTSTVEDLQTGSKTTNSFSKIEYNLGLNESLFTERFLRRPPREATR